VESEEGCLLGLFGRVGVGAEGDDTLDRIARLASRVVGCEVALVSLVDERRELFAGQHGLGAAWRDSRETPLSQSICRLVVASGAVVQIDDTATDERTAELPARTVLEIGSYLGVPLSDDRGIVFGCLGAINRHPHAWTVDERDVLVDVSAAANSELRARLAASLAAEATGRVQTMADASDVLSRSLDIEMTLESVLEVVTAGLAAACVLYLPAAPEWPRRLLWRTAQRTSPDLHIPGAGLEQLLASEPVAAVLAGAAAFRRLPEIGVGGPSGEGREVLVVPLGWHDEVLGVWLLEPADRPRFADLDVTLLVDLARRAAITLRNARVYDHERAIAVRLQRDLLPALPAIDGLDLCAVYEPSEVGVEIGGDWYDIAQTPAGAVVATVGDVTGHDLRAAAAMGRLSAAIRCYAHDGLPPADILARLDGFGPHLLGDLHATTICLSLTPAELAGDWSINAVSAGHLPPVLIPRAGPPTVLDMTNGPLLGLGCQSRRLTTQATLHPGDALVCYSDGLVEHRHEHLDTGIARLLEITATLDNTGPMDDYCQKLLIETRPSRDDDIALLVLRAHT
jgi:GAF domain-containing protein